MRLILICLLAVSHAASAQILGVQIPNNASSYNHDEITTSSGTRCRQALGSNTTIEAGIIGSESDDDRDVTGETGGGYGRQESGGAVYARISYALGAPKRMDCSEIYRLEVETLRRELELMRENYAMD